MGISYRIKNKLFRMLLSKLLSISWLVIFVGCSKTIRGPSLLPRETFYNDPQSNDNFNRNNPHYIRVNDAIRLRRMTDHIKNILIECRKVKKCENVEDNF